MSCACRGQDGPRSGVTCRGRQAKHLKCHEKFTKVTLAALGLRALVRGKKRIPGKGGGAVMTRGSPGSVWRWPRGWDRAIWRPSVKLALDGQSCPALMGLHPVFNDRPFPPEGCRADTRYAVFRKLHQKVAEPLPGVAIEGGNRPPDGCTRPRRHFCYVYGGLPLCA